MQSAVLTLSGAGPPPVFNSTSLKPLRNFNSRNPVLVYDGRPIGVTLNPGDRKKWHNLSFSGTCSREFGSRRKFISSTTAAASGGGGGSISESDDDLRKLLQVFLWIAEGVYIIWLFLLPYAPVSRVYPFSF